jgi:hypothetical protein
MSPEMVSGPDMGGGFLFQLSREDEGGSTRFAYHAQDGAADAGGPPLGSPEPLGYYHPARSCMFGGPRCWHREFLLPGSEVGRVRAGYNRTRFVMEGMMAQLYGHEEVPVEAALRELLDLIARPPNSGEGGWWVGGSTALWLRGLGPRPHDVDLGVNTAGAAALADALAEYLIEPSGPALEADGRSRLAARAFLGTHRRGVRIEWAVADARSPPEFAERVADQLDHVSWDGRSLPVPPIELSMLRAATKFDAPTWNELLTRLAPTRLDLAVLEPAMRGTAVPADRADQLRAHAGRGHP